MAQAHIFEGTWEELAARAEELRRYSKLMLIATEPHLPAANGYRADLTPEERIRQMDAFAETNRDLPHLPDEAFDRENLYGDDEP